MTRERNFCGFPSSVFPSICGTGGMFNAIGSLCAGLISGADLPVGIMEFT